MTLGIFNSLHLRDPDRYFVYVVVYVVGTLISSVGGSFLRFKYANSHCKAMMLQDLNAKVMDV